MLWRRMQFGVCCLGLLLAGPGALLAEDSPWTSKADMPTPRDSFAAAAVNGWIYTFGGRVEPNEGLQTVEAYDPATDLWVRKADMPTGRRGASAVVVDGKIYVMGGFLGSADLKALAAVEVYDPATDTWTKKADMLHPRGFTAAELVDGKVYVIAGYSSGSTTSTVQDYDPATDQWTEKTRMPVANSHLAAGLVGERIYVVGGIDFPLTFFVYDPAADTWERQEDLPIGRILPGVSVVDGMLYVMGGVPVNGSGTPLATVGQYDPSFGLWSERTPMPTARAGLSAVAVGGKVFAIGGVVDNAPWQSPKHVVGTVEEYTPAVDRVPSPGNTTETPPAETTPGQGLFAEVTQEAVRAPLINARGTTFGDYDNDGWPDMFLAEDWTSPPYRVGLLHNEGNGRFVDQTVAIQADVPEKLKGGGSIFGDYDNDGDLDLFVPIGAFQRNQSNLNMLLRNERGVFTDVALAAGLTDVLATDNAIWLDYDRDGLLDLYTGNQGTPDTRNKLYRNQGDGTFADATGQAGLDLQLHPELGGSNGGMAAGDLDGDGWPDLYVPVWRAPGRLFLSDGRGGFTDGSTGEVADDGQAYGVAVGDIDNDGDLDLFHAAFGFPGELYRSGMLLNLGKGQFLDVTEGVGLSALAASRLGGGALSDLDNDGDLDLLTTLSHFLYLNQGDGTFTDQTEKSGINDVGLTLSLGDYDLDGFLDVLFASDSPDPPSFMHLYRNQGSDTHWLRVELVGIKSNRNGIGSRLIATSGELRQMREIFGGMGFNQDEMVAHFGLDQRTKVDRLEIRWPSGQVDVLTDIPADQKIRVIEGSGRYHRVDPTRWQQAPPETLVAGATTHLNLAVQPALFDPEARITRVTADLSPLGGGTEVALAAEGDGAYHLRDFPLPVTAPSGFRTLSVLIDQNTSLGPHWTRLSRQVTVMPGGDLVVFDEVLAQGWQAEGNRRIKRLDLNEAGVVHQGSLAGAFEGEAAFTPWTVTFKAPVPISPVGYTVLHFAFHPGEVVPPATARFTATLVPGKLVNLLENARVNLNQKEWQVVEIPVEAFEREGPIESISFSGNFAGTFYLDDIRLVAPTPSPATLVEEDRTTALPQSFSLSQNFPNPFNSETVIRFALPEGGEVELTVYNLAGQRVAKLVEGTREAGSYTVRWDGRDQQGHELASGVYLYRLQVGAQVKTHKLALVR